MKATGYWPDWSTRAGRVVYLSTVHDKDAVTLQHSVDAVGDGQHGAVMEGFSYGVLDQGVCLGVNGGRGLIQKDDLGGQSACNQR